MRLISGFESIELDDHILAVPIGENAVSMSGLLKLNASGSEILALLMDDMTENEIIETLALKYDDSDTIKHYVHSFVETLCSFGLLIDDSLT